MILNKCIKCGGNAELTGAGYCDDWIEGPFYVRCMDCGKESESYCSVNNAVKDWNMKNEREEAIRENLLKHYEEKR